MTLFTILLGGDFVATPGALDRIAGSRVVAADSGMRHASVLGVVPELWVGDFDSVPAALSAQWPDAPRQVSPTGKDKTDGELAVDAALERGATSLILAGSFGGDRPDHAFLHMTLAIRLARAGLPVLLTSGAQEGTPLPLGQSSFNYAAGTLFSILGFSTLTGLSVLGARWPLSAVTVPFGSSLTISNEVSGHLTVTLESGNALLVAHIVPPEH